MEREFIMATKSNGSKSSSGPHFTVPGLTPDEGDKVAELLQVRLTALIDLQLTLKHIHWNVVGPYFIGVHQMIDPQVDEVREMVDTIAERIATLGRQPNGLPGFIAKNRSWDDYSIGRATVPEHLGALDVVYQGIIAEHRKAIETLEDLDLVSQDMLVTQTGALEQFHWFVRAHLESADGSLSTKGAEHEATAARQAKSGAQRSA
jgi:starvation-inducible DNA-binding protein